MDPVVVIDQGGQIKSCNQEFQKLLGFQRWELIGQNIIIIMPEHIRKFHDGFLKRYVKSKMKRIIGEMRTGVVAIKKDGAEIPVVLKVSELSSGTDIAFIGMLFCIFAPLTSNTVFYCTSTAIVKNVTFEEELFRIKKMLSNMLPPSVTAKIQAGEKEIAETLLGSVIFIDIVGFTDFMYVTWKI